MGKNSNIAWTDHTFNPWTGCAKVSPACKHCYAMELVNKFGGDFLGKRVVKAEAGWKEPLKWNRDAEAEGVRKKVFCASLADVFEDWAGPILDHKGEKLYSAWHHDQPDWVATNEPCEGDPLTMDDVRDRLFRLIDATPYLDWQLLTKRPENILKMWPRLGFPDAGIQGTLGRRLYLSNVWLGTTVENQEQADKRIPELLKCRDLSPRLFLSCEPLLEPVCLDELLYCQECYGTRLKNDGPQGIEKDCDECDGRPLIDWIIAGGESGPNYRYMSPHWVQSLHDQCKAAGVPFFCKQGAGPKSGQQYDLPDHLFSVREFPV